VGLREEKKALQRQAIVDTALALFRERGFEQTRVAEVTGRLRISETTFFNYFPTKQAVLEAVAEDILTRSTTELNAENDERPVLERLETAVSAFAHNYAGDRELATLLAVHTRLWLDPLRQAQVHRLLVDLFEKGRQRGEIRPELPADQLAELFQAVILTTIASWLIGRAEAEPLDQRVLRAWHVLRCGLEPGPPPKRAARAGRTRTGR